MGFGRVEMIGIIIAAIVVIVVAALFFSRQGNASDTTGASLGPESNWSSEHIAQETEFWKIIESTKSGNVSEDAQASELRNQLNKLHTDDLAKFIGVFDRLMYKSYYWDLWGAAYTISGGASDDGFEDFRKWLISRGKDFFDQAVANPDRLAEMIELNYQGDTTFEEFSYIPLEVWLAKTGKQATDLPKAKDTLYPSEPIGEPFDEDAEHLAERYPNLWARFGEHPLG